MKKATDSIFFWAICAIAFCLILITIFSLTVTPVMPALAVKADTSGNGITKDEIIFECSYGDVKFTHRKHNVDYKIDCYHAKCHHTWDADKNQKSGDLCRDCHKKQAEGKTPSSKDAFHKSCKGCHEDLKKEGKPTGPTACKECHKKK